MKERLDIKTGIGHAVPSNDYRRSVETLSSLIKENLRSEVFRTLWTLTILNSRVVGLDVTDRQDLTESMVGLVQYRESDILAQFIDMNSESIISFGTSRMELSPFVIERRLLRRGRDKGIIIGWITRDLKTVDRLVVKMLRLERTRTIWIDRHQSGDSTDTEVLVAEPNETD